MTSTPVPSTAIVEASPSADIAPRCAAASMPSARPLTTVTPARASAAAKPSALAMPCCVALRLPTIATAGRFSSSSRPTANSTAGGSAVVSRACGYSGSASVSSA